MGTASAVGIAAVLAATPAVPAGVARPAAAADGLPEDGFKTRAAKAGRRISPTATGEAGRVPARRAHRGEAVVLVRRWRDGGGETTVARPGTAAKTGRRNGEGAATVHHRRASGNQVTLKADMTDDRGNSVTQTVTRAYDVRYDVR
ncbi:hypothetical protein ACFVYF_25280 [Streptomyces sp. NPDC058274]|uniref:hypothetical protein n=1 Tax=Streptomyces sp. NPDC058274 TaxID=3346416 RepID=UPI0036EC8A07